MLINVVKSSDNVTSKKRKFLTVDKTLVSVRDSYEMFRQTYIDYLNRYLGITLKNNDTVLYIFLETLLLLHNKKQWDIESEQVIDIMDYAIGEDLIDDRYFDFRDIKSRAPQLSIILDNIMNQLSNFDMVDYVVDEMDVKIVLEPCNRVKPSVKIILNLPVDLDTFFIMYGVSEKKVFTQMFISKLIDIALNNIVSNGDNETSIEQMIDDVVIVNKLYKYDGSTDTEENGYNHVIIEKSDYHMLKRSIKQFTDELFNYKDLYNFKVNDIVIEDIVNKRIIGYVRGE